MAATPDSTLANPEQLIADLQRQLAEREAELAECKAERDEARDQQTATAEIVEVINRSPGNLAPVFDAILGRAHALCGAAHGILWIRAGEEFRLAAVHGEPSFVEAMQQVGPLLPRPAGGSLTARLLGGEPLIHLADAQANADLPPRIQRLCRAWGVRTLLAVPLRKEDALLGFITAFRKQLRPFSDKQIALPPRQSDSDYKRPKLTSQHFVPDIY